MTIESTKKAISEAKRFIAAAQEAIAANNGTMYTSKENGAAKRASMDLTRALAAMRRPL